MLMKKIGIKKDIIISLFFLVVPFIFYFNFFFLNGFWAPGDGISTYAPMRLLLKESLSHFSLPLWNGYVNLGVPFHADIQNSIFYLPNLILYTLFPLKFAYNYMFLLHLSLAGIFVYFYLKQINISWRAALLGGIVFMFCGSLNVRLGHVTILNAIIWLPLILYYYEKLIATRKKRYLFLMSIAFSTQIFAGFIQIAVYSAIILFIYFIFSLKRYDSIKQWFFDKINFSIITIGFSFIQLGPLLILSNFTGRTKITYEYFSSYSLTFKSLLTLLFPNIYGVHIPNTPYPLYKYPYFGDGNLTEFGFYLGILPLVMALFVGVKFFKNDRYIRIWMVIGLTCLLLALGSSIPIINKIMFEVPLYNSFRVSARILFGFSLAISILFAKQVDFIIKEENKEIFKKKMLGLSKLLGFILLGSIAFIVLANKLLSSLVIKAPDFSKQPLVNWASINDLLISFSFKNPAVYIPLLLMCIGVIFLILLRLKQYNSNIIFCAFILFILIDAHTFSFYHEKVPNNYSNDDEIIDYLQGINNTERIWPMIGINSGFDMDLSPNKNMIHHQSIINGYVTFLPEQYKNLTGIVETGVSLDYFQLLLNNELLSSLNTKYIITSNIYSEAIQAANRVNNKVETVHDFGQFSLPASDGVNASIHQSLVKVEPNTLYKFNVKFNTNTSSEVYFDLYGEGYDNNEQQSTIKSMSSKDESIKYFFSGSDIPNEVYLRLFSFSSEVVGFEYAKLEKVMDADQSQRNDKYSIVLKTDQYTLFENMNVLPKIYSVSQVQENSSESELTKNLNLHEIALVDSYENDNLSLASIDILEKKNGYSKAMVSSTMQSFIVHSESFYPGWKAYVDGKEVQIYRVNGLIQGIESPKGKHIIEFKYQPSSVKFGFVIHLLTFVYILFLSRRSIQIKYSRNRG